MARRESRGRSLSIPVLKVRQPIGDFYIGVMKHSDICDISYVDRRSIGEGKDEYMGIQRELSRTRVKEIGGYVNTMDATFPTGIVVAVDERCVKYSESTQQMILSEYIENDEERIPYESMAKVIDGQHRIAGLHEFQGKDFEVNLTVFVGLDNSDQANIFSTVNLTQTKVNKSLTYDLFALAKSRSPQKTCHNIAVAVNNNEKSPFYHRIKRLGVATGGKGRQTLTQATFVEALLRHLSGDPVKDRDLLKRGKRLEMPADTEARTRIFRRRFIAEGDLEIAEIIWNYFEAVQMKWPQAWAAEEGGWMLNRTNGFRALMRLLPAAYDSVVKGDEVVDTAKFYTVFKNIKLENEEFNTSNFPPGTAGESKLYRLLSDEAKLG